MTRLRPPTHQRYSGSSFRARSKNPWAARLLSFVSDNEYTKTLPRIVRSTDVRVFGTGAVVGFRLDNSKPQRIRQSRDHLILKFKEVGYVLFESVGPEMRAAVSVDKLGVHAHSVLVALH